MSRIGLIADPTLATSWTGALRDSDFAVVSCADSIEFQEKFGTEVFDIVIVDISNPDWGEAMLIPQARAAWPDCRIIAVVSNYTFRSSAVYQMGLWSPDQVLMKPVSPRVLLATVSFLWAQIKTVAIRRTLTGESGVPNQPDGIAPAIVDLSAISGLVSD